MGTTVETRITSEQGKEAIYQAHLSKDAIEKVSKINSSASEIDALINELKGLKASATQINYIADEERAVPDGFDISLLPYFRVWKKKGTRLFETNIKAKKVFEDVFADKIVYVDIAIGDDTTGTGTISNPYKTLYKGLSTKPLSPSNGGKLTVYVKAGTYADANGWNATNIYAAEINVIAYNGLVTSTQSVSTSYNGQIESGKKSYIEGIVFDGGKSPFNFIHAANVFTTAYFKNCAFNNSVSENGFQTVRNGLYILENCKAKGNVLDGFNYHNYDTIKNNLVIEINCQGIYNGKTGATNNGSTVHEETKIIRINGIYNYNSNRNIQDIGSCRSWNLGCEASYGAQTTELNFALGVGIDTDYSKMWLDNCISNGSNFGAGIYQLSVNSTLYAYEYIDNCTQASTYIPIAYDYKA